MNSKNLDHIYITKIHATDVTGGHCQLAVECDGRITKTSIETVPFGNGVVEWDEQIPLSTHLSSNVLFKVYASFQKMALKFGNGKLIGICEISVGELLDRNERLETIKLPASKDENASSCLSLRITTERRTCDSNDECLPHLHKPNTRRQLEELIGEGDSALLRYHRYKSQVDLDEAIACFGLACHRCPIDHPMRLAAQFSLANAMFVDCQANRYEFSLDVPVKLYHDTLRLRVRDDADHAQTALQLCLALLVRFERRGDETDRTEVMDLLARLMKISPADGHIDQAGRRVAKGSVSSQARDSRLGQVEDGNGTDLIHKARVALHTSSRQDSRRPVILYALGKLLRRRFEERGNLADIHEAILMLEEAVELVVNDHPMKPEFLGDLGISLRIRFEQLGKTADLERAIFIAEEALRLTPDSHPDKPGGFNSLGNALLRRFEWFGDLADITKSVSMFEQVVRFTPDGHPNKSCGLSNLGSVLFRRFERLGDLVDVTKSISTFEQAIRLTPDGHPDKLCQLNNMGRALLCHFERLGDLADVTKAVSMFEQAVHLTPDGHPHKVGGLNNLGNALFRRFERLDDLADITKSVSIVEQAIRLTPDGHPDKPGGLNNLGNMLFRRFERLDDLADIAKSVSMYEQAVRLTPDGHPDKPTRLNNLGNALSRRFERLGDLADATKSVFMFEQAIHLTPDGHPEKPSWLNNLGNALSRRFERLGDLADITKSVSTFEQAIRLTPDGHPDKPSFLNNLGNAVLSRFGRLGDLADITKSVCMIEKAVHLTPDGHPDKPARLYNLANSFMTRFDSFRHSSDLVAAISRFSAATQSSTGPIAIRFAAARKWIASAELEGNSRILIHAYTVSLTLLPQLAWMGLPLVERHRVLVGADDVARGAAAAALDAGLLDMAVEWLEQGRSIVWTQLLQLRTPVDLLRVTHPALADDFEHTSKELESVSSSRDHVLSAEALIHDSWSQEEVVRKHHTLTLRREKLLADIRSLPGFDRFLLPKTIGQLAALASCGPVVYLNASQRRCDGLIAVPGQESVIHVPLSNVTYRHVERMHQLLVEHDRLTVPTDDISLLTPSAERSAVHREGGPAEVEEILCNRFQLVLQFLWSNVVRPVLDVLTFSTLPSDAMVKMPRIFWCPTGPFAFLPIHAAGIYDTSPSGPKLSDFAISSYIPTLSALAPEPAKPPRSPSNICLLIVPQPPTDGQPHLWGVNGEIDTIKALSDESQFVTTEDSDSTVEDVMQKMDLADWVHFACHGVQDPIQPLDSGLCLANDRRLRLSDIIKLSRRPGGLAFLSACQTAKGEEKLSEESVHLAAGMLLAGYDGVIATMWSIMDNDAPKVTRDVYKYLFRDGKVPDTKEAAEAVHHAVVRLRDEDKVPFSSWVPFIHVGR